MRLVQDGDEKARDELIERYMPLARSLALRYRPGYDAAKLDKIHQQHHAIILAVTGHDPELATQLLTQHIRTSLDERLDAYDVWERETSLQKNIPIFFGHRS